MSDFTSFTNTPTSFNGLIIKQQGQQQSTTGKPAAFYDIVESPKGLIRIVRDVFGAFYLWISKNGEQEHPKRIIAISTIRFVESKKVSSKNQSHSAGKVCFTANCQEFPSAAECQQEAAFQVKIPLANYDGFVKIVKYGIEQAEGFRSCAIKQGFGMMKSFSLTEECCFRDLIVQKKSGQVAGTEQTKKFYDVVESPKGQIIVVRDYFGADYLWVSKNSQQDMACIIPISTIRGVTACKITGKKPTPHDHQTTRAAAAGHRQPLESPAKQLYCRVQVEFTANCQTLVDGPENEIQHGTVFWVKLPTASYNKFLKLIGGVSNKH